MELAEPVFSVRNVQALFRYFDSAKSKIEHLTGHILNVVRALSKLNPPLASIAIYALCTVAGFVIWIAMGFLDLAAGTRVLDAVIHVTEFLNEHVLPALQLLNGFLALLVGFSMLVHRPSINLQGNINGNIFGINPYRMSISSLRSVVIRALPKGKYGCLRRSDDINRNEPSSCAICFSCILEEDEVRILPNCVHYFHISCIDRWLLPCTVNHSSCPLCRAVVIVLGSWQAVEGAHICKYCKMESFSPFLFWCLVSLILHGGFFQATSFNIFVHMSLRWNTL